MTKLNTLHPVLVAKGEVVKRKDGSTVARPLGIAKDGTLCVNVAKLGGWVAVDIATENRVSVTDRKVEYLRHAKLADIKPKASANDDVKTPASPKAKAARLTKKVSKPKASAATPDTAVLSKTFGLSESEAAAVLAILAGKR